MLWSEIGNKVLVIARTLQGACVEYRPEKRCFLFNLELAALVRFRQAGAAHAACTLQQSRAFGIAYSIVLLSYCGFVCLVRGRVRRRGV